MKTGSEIFLQREIKKIFVCCPGGLVTGGPELLHQLVHALRAKGHDAYMSYFPTGKGFAKPKEYSVYDAPSSDIEDAEASLVILPEVATRMARRVKAARVAVWWLSVDYYFQRKGESRIADAFMRFFTLATSRLPVRSMTQFIHFTQSAYARDFLKSQGVPSRMLSDYLAKEHVHRAFSVTGRENIIAYNPKKGLKTTLRLIRGFPQLQFVAIQGMTKTEVRDLLSKAKVYIDFGTHPGKDRLPREAAIAGCCVVTGRRGSSGNDEDVGIPEKYKIDEKMAFGDFASEFELLINSIYEDFERRSRDFDDYRQSISCQYSVFERQVVDIFGSRA